MKHLPFSLLISVIMISNVVFSQQNKVEPKVEIYCIENSTDTVDVPLNLGVAKLNSDPIVSWDDITSYDQRAHKVDVSDTGRARLISSLGQTFVICVNGNPIYGGKIIKKISSIQTLCPVIYAEDLEGSNAFSIRLGHLHGKAILSDERGNNVIMHALDVGKKLVR